MCGPSLASNAGVVGNDGTTYQPVSCSRGAYVAISHDEGSTYSWEPVKDAPPQNGLAGSLQLAVDQSDNLYGMWVAGDQLYLAISNDHAKTWSTPMKVTAPGVHTITRPAFAAGARGQVAITYYASHDPSAQTLTAYITQTLDALAPQPLFYSGALNDPAHPIYVDAGLTGGSPRADFVGGSYDSAGTFWAGVVKQLGPADANKNYATTGYVGRLAFLGQTAGAAAPASPPRAGCLPAGRLVFRINPVPHGRVVRVLAYVNGRQVASTRGHSLTSVAFARPAGRRLVIRIITINNLGGRVVTLRTFRGCTHGRITGTVHRHPKSPPRTP
jgi:hypothetical protein